ncbi:MAG: hypothetical protein ACP5FH_10435 [Terracidiphilus sp.]
MRPFTRYRLLCGIFPVLLAATGPARAQVLVRRPPTRPNAPARASQHNAASPAAPLLPRGTSLQVETTRAYPMHSGQAIEGRLLFPLYLQGHLAVPQNTILQGRVVALRPDRQMRWRGRLRGDFTPFHTAEVRFERLLLPGGAIPISSATAAYGAPVLHLTASGGRKRSFFSRSWAQTRSGMHHRIAFFTAPGFGGRALQMLYRQLPYHPERIPMHTAWSFELTAPVRLPDPPAPTPDPPAAAPDPPRTATHAAHSEIWQVHAVLTRELTSARAHPSDPVEALVVEPVYDSEKRLVIPQGSTLSGKVTAARAARSLGRNGKLRFTFQQIIFPAGAARPVEGSLAGAETETPQRLSLDSEGTVTPRNPARAVAPLLLTMLAGRALDQDGNLYADNGVASNGFGVAGRIAGLAAGSRNMAAGIGFYAAGLSVYENFLRRGRDVDFPKDTRIDIETSPLRAPVLQP